MTPREKIFIIFLSPVIFFFEDVLHLSFFWLLFIILVFLTFRTWRAPEWKIKKQNNLIEKIVVVIVKVMVILCCLLGLYGAVSDQFIAPSHLGKDIISEFGLDENINISKKSFLLYFLVSTFGAYRVFRNGILLPYKKKKAGDKKAKIDIMSVVYFAMLSIFAITSLFIVLGVIKT